jgi:ankyrin repeat protein
MFSATECLERREFTVLHKIVLGFISLDLETELSASTAGINKQDSNERTPLSIAAERGDTNSLSILLRYGADPNLASNCGASPLHFAASATNPACIPLLLANGANPDSMTNWHQTPLHYVAAYTKDSRHAELLLASGSNPEAIDLDGMDPLEWAAITGNTPVAEVLINRSVSLFNRDNSGDSALIQSIRGHHHDILALLIRHRALAELHSPGKEKIWDVIATAADLTSMQLLIEANFDHGLLSHENAGSLLDLVKTRADVSPELITAFQALVENPELTENTPLLDEDAVDIWEDAVETI